MMKTTDGLGERLQRSREQAGLSQQEAADAVGVAREIISYWEHDRRMPSPTQLDRLTALYRTTLRYLAGEEVAPLWAEEHALLYRGVDARTPHVRAAVQQWLDFLGDWTALLAASGEWLPGRGRPPKDIVQVTQSTTDSRRAPGLAERVRTHYRIGLDAIPDLFAFLDAQGVLVCRASLGRLAAPGDVSGIFYNHPRLGYCILVNMDMTRGRQVFTLAHEFGHALFHYRETGLVSRAGDADRKERFADAFAGHFLVPAPTLRSLVGHDADGPVQDPFEVIRLQRYFRVSYATMLYRLLAEGLLSRPQYDEYQSYSPSHLAAQLGFDVHEYRHPPGADDVITRRFPSSVLRRLRTLTQEEIMSVAKVSSLLQIAPETISDNLLGNPEQASPEERREFDELPPPPRPRLRGAETRPSRPC